MGFNYPEFQEGHSLCLLVKSVAEDQRIITVSVDKDLIQDALVCYMYIIIHVYTVHVHVGYWPSVTSRWLDIGQHSFVCLQTKMQLRFINTQKDPGQYPAILNEQARSIICRIYYMAYRKPFSCRIQQAIPSKPDRPILPAWVADHTVVQDLIHLVSRQDESM